MFKILKKEKLNSNVTLMDIYAPRIAKKAQPGQFIIFIIDEGEKESHLQLLIIMQKWEVLQLYFKK